MDFSAINIWCWVIPLLCVLIGGIFGFLLGKYKGENTSDNLKLWQEKSTKLQADLDSCNSKLAANASFSFDAAAAKTAFGKNIKENDLKIVEGIGPKIEAMFIDAGIKTWKDLSEVAVADCQKILDNGGSRYIIHDPASWPMQGKMAYEGKWKELAKWQDKHDYGKL